MQKKNLIQILILIIAIFLIYQICFTLYTIVNPNIPCSILGFKLFEVKNDTMESVLKKGEWIVTTTPKEEDLHKGDIIAFKSDNNFIIHRIENIIYKKDGTFYETKGDNNMYPDNALVEISSIQGIYLFKISMGVKVVFILIIASLIGLLSYRKLYLKQSYTKSIQKNDTNVK